MSGIFDNEAPEPAEPRDTLEWLRQGAAEAGDAVTEERAETALTALDHLEAELADARAALAGFAVGLVALHSQPQYTAHRQ